MPFGSHVRIINKLGPVHNFEAQTHAKPAPSAKFPKPLYESSCPVIGASCEVPLEWWVA
jgi:hypothetical protein